MPKTLRLSHLPTYILATKAEISLCFFCYWKPWSSKNAIQILHSWHKGQQCEGQELWWKRVWHGQLDLIIASKEDELSGRETSRRCGHTALHMQWGTGSQTVCFNFFQIWDNPRVMQGGADQSHDFGVIGLLSMQAGGNIFHQIFPGHWHRFFFLAWNRITEYVQNNRISCTSLFVVEKTNTLYNEAFLHTGQKSLPSSRRQKF